MERGGEVSDQMRTQFPAGLPDLFNIMYQKGNIYVHQMTKYTIRPHIHQVVFKYPMTIQNNKMYLFQGLQKYNEIGIFGTQI
jgi:hypothetical protein